MTREERHALLREHGGAEIFAQMRERVRIAPEPPNELVEKLRRIFAHPGGAVPAAEPSTVPASDAA